MILRASLIPLLASVALGVFVAAIPGEAKASPFDTLLGSWGGTGEIHLDKGRTERIRATPTTPAAALSSGSPFAAKRSYKIEIRSKLSYSGGRLSGNWEERTFNASGTATGSASDSAIKLSITGPVTGSMNVNFTKSRQSVSITTRGTALQGVNITLGRS